MFYSTANHSVWLIWIPGNVKNLFKKKIKSCSVDHSCVFVFFQILSNCQDCPLTTQNTMLPARMGDLALELSQELLIHFLITMCLLTLGLNKEVIISYHH